MHIDTTNNRALLLLKEAQTSIAGYQRSKDRGNLERAKSTLGEALEADENYLRARFWRGLVKDLLGETAEAVKELSEINETISHLERQMANERVTTKKAREIQHFLSMVKYNLGVAYYHQYSQGKVDQAIQTFEDVIKRPVDDKLKLYARTWLAKAYAMRMGPKPPPVNAKQGTEFYLGEEDFDTVTKFFKSKAPKENARKYFDLSIKESDSVISEMRKRRAGLSEAANDIESIVYDARAVALMFYTDFFEEDRISNLKEALKALETADKFRRRDWTIHSNFGSVHMRLGHWLRIEAQAGQCSEADILTQQSEENFDRALEYLNEVVNSLRPGYGFALYEIGRAYRLRGEFGKALDYFTQALEVKSNRDVSDSRIKFEKERASRKLTDFP